MFFHFWPPYSYLNNERIQQFESISEIASSRLYNLTYWGDYGGDTVSRFHHDIILENAPDLVKSITGNYGDGLVLNIGAIGTDITNPKYADQRQFLSEFFRWVYDGGRNDYTIFENAGDYSDWESEAIDKTIQSDVDSWLGSDVKSLLTSNIRYAIADSDLDFTNDDVISAIGDLFYDAEEYPYFETATSLVYPFGHIAIAERMIENYAASLIPKQTETLFSI